MEWLSLLGVCISLAIFIYLAYKGYNIIFLSVLADRLGVPYAESDYRFK